ncbi:MAG: hypothetical protein WC889_05710 [Myxococcota bacterium]|jgi:DNA-directed RNA polymerase subunit RPC12/RpoP
MTIDFECVNCGEDFEIDAAVLIEDPTKLQCPSCDVKADQRTVEDLMSALDDVMASMAHLRKKFQFAINIETDDLPAPYAETESEDEDEEVWDKEEEDEK